MAVKAVRRPGVDKWTAYWMSLCLPGTGQMMAGSPSCVPWFVGVGLLWSLVNTSDLPIAAPAAAISSVVLALLSAEHAKRLLEPSRATHAGRPKPRVRVNHREVGRTAVDLRIEMFLDRPADEVWSEMADFAKFACIDPFHERMIVQAAEVHPGVDLVLVHRIFGFRFLRFGRLLKWQEGRGYAFSDLSRRCPTRGFPHVFFFSVEPVGDGRSDACRLTVTVRGKWTALGVPRRVGMWWLRYVCYEHARLLCKTL